MATLALPRPSPKNTTTVMRQPNHYKPSSPNGFVKRDKHHGPSTQHASTSSPAKLNGSPLKRQRAASTASSSSSTGGGSASASDGEAEAVEEKIRQRQTQQQQQQRRRREPTSATSDKRMVEEGEEKGRDEDPDGDDDDKMEGTSARGAEQMMKARLGQPGGSSATTMKHLDIAALLKDPLIFLPPRLPEDTSQQIPYEPLPTGPSLANGASAPSVNGVKATAKSDGTPDGKGKATLSKTPSAANGSAVSTNGTSSSNSAIIPLSWSWPQNYPVGPGYHNLGNTCFLNSTLQALTHTAPLVATLMGDVHHSPSMCRVVEAGKFCLLCAMQKHIRTCFKNGRSYGAIQPNGIVNKLQFIAKNMRVGRQEDAHEFLRFSLDAMQQSAMINLKRPPTPINVKALTEDEKHSTLIHRIFGGKLRSRVTCQSCGHNSDTFDHFMDLSLDVSRAYDIKESLREFVKVDELKGSNKYKCEECKKLVNAKKQFTIYQAPQILHIHLKRFTPTGKKITGHIGYPETLQLHNYMSEDVADRNPTYRLYAVVCHSGSGPHSGHYFAHVRSGAGRWHCMNDSSVSNTDVQTALQQRNAYLLFYERCNRLGDVVGKFKVPSTNPQQASGATTNANGELATSATSAANRGTTDLGKRKQRDEDQDGGEQTSPFSAQRIKTNGHLSSSTTSSPKFAGNLQQQRSSPFVNGSSTSKHHHSNAYSSSSPHRDHQFGHKQHKKQHSLHNGGKPIRSGNFFSSSKASTRPKVIELMKGKPRPS